ncbi:MAG TPA: M20/M25/M40 family metallo-hydrolase [Acidimicrobiia bacterium]|nr:M20/M25/M40 family metallo-hydrolase [Acidimicrobiia bacterium]
MRDDLAMPALDAPTARAHVDEVWDRDIVPTISDFIRIPNVSVAFDPGWAEAGHMSRAVDLVAGWLRARPIDGAAVEVHEIPGRTPVLLVDVPAFGASDGDAGSVLLYGHLDKQPPLGGWRDGLSPWEPVREGDRLYGRGGADDGYAAFAALAAIEAVRAGGGSHRRGLVLIEASEESGSPDLPAHLERLGHRLAGTTLVVALDSWCWSYDRLWLTTSLRGLLGVELSVDVLTEGVHSGMAGGVVPSSFRILRRLLDRVEDPDTGRILVDELHVEIPAERLRQIEEVAANLGDVAATYPARDGLELLGGTTADRLRARTWEPCLEVIAAEGLPSLAGGGNVLRAGTTAGLSFRLPPTCDPAAAAAAVERALTAAPPHGATVRAATTTAEGGWAAPATEPWLAAALTGASRTAFGQDPRAVGEGGTIPFMGMLGRSLPDAQFVITGVLGPGSNAHGPNEFLHVPMAARVTEAVAHLLDAHARQAP